MRGAHHLESNGYIRAHHLESDGYKRAHHLASDGYVSDRSRRAHLPCSKCVHSLEPVVVRREQLAKISRASNSLILLAQVS